MTEVFSVRIRKELKEVVKKYRDVDWRGLVEKLIEDVAAERELRSALEELDALLRDLSPVSEPAWKAIREAREE
ncbi:MAG: hypothetical protein J7K82_04330 [Thermoproteales archaeon]|nr:hypothetical protein [Thermoproteales archaeon]